MQQQPLYHANKKPLSFSMLRHHYTHPHELYNELRASDSLYYDPSSGCWLVTGRIPIVTILSDPRFTSEMGKYMIPQMTGLQNLSHLVSQQMLFMDGAKHQEIQRMIVRYLSQAIKDIPTAIELTAREALAGMQERQRGDFVQGYATPVSLLTIAQILGLSTEDREELAQVERWSDTFADVTSGYLAGNMQDIAALKGYFQRALAHKRHNPGNDLLSVFIESEHVFEDEDTLIANCMMIFAAGRITTKKLLSNGVSQLLDTWDEKRRAHNEHATFVKSLGEELLRSVTPTRYVARRATEDVDLSLIFPGNHHIRQGQTLLLFLEAGNHDPSSFALPGQLDPMRHPNKHISFGHGKHTCPGASLARLEIQIALNTLLSSNTTSLKAGHQKIWNPNPNLGGYQTFEMMIEPTHT